MPVGRPRRRGRPGRTAAYLRSARVRRDRTDAPADVHRRRRDRLTSRPEVRPLTLAGSPRSPTAGHGHPPDGMAGDPDPRDHMAWLCGADSRRHGPGPRWPLVFPSHRWPCRCKFGRRSARAECPPEWAHTLSVRFLTRYFETRPLRPFGSTASLWVSNVPYGPQCIENPIRVIPP